MYAGMNAKTNGAPGTGRRAVTFTSGTGIGMRLGNVRRVGRTGRVRRGAGLLLRGGRGRGAGAGVGDGTAPKLKSGKGAATTGRGALTTTSSKGSPGCTPAGISGGGARTGGLGRGAVGGAGR